MKLFFDFLPIILFFIAYKFAGGEYTFSGEVYQVEGIYAATAVMIVVSLLQVSYSWLRHRKVERAHLITLVLVVLLGGATIWLQNPEFIMWKPTAVNWLFALVFIGAQLFTDKTLLERMMAEHIQLPIQVWTRLNVAWIMFFILSGVANIYVAFNFDEATWVNFKLFGMLGLTIVFVVAQSIYLARHAIEAPK
ncbi:septation protein A [Methylophaga sp.]|uniref:septation protein A n=1 Tax=Methylophaga sp. TaxID=2024840 RepID=UPI003F6A34ED